MSLHNRLPAKPATVRAAVGTVPPVIGNALTDAPAIAVRPMIFFAVRPLRCRDCGRTILKGAETIADQHRVCWEVNFCWEWRAAQYRAESEQRRAAQQHQQARQPQQQPRQSGQWQGQNEQGPQGRSKAR